MVIIAKSTGKVIAQAIVSAIILFAIIPKLHDRAAGSSLASRAKAGPLFSPVIFIKASVSES